MNELGQSRDTLVIMKQGELISGIAITKDMYIHDNGIYCIDDLCIKFPDNTFQCLSSVYDKINYYIASSCSSMEDIEELATIIKANNPEFKGFKMPVEDWLDPESEPYFGCTYGNNKLKETLETLKISLDEFIRNTKYIIVVDAKDEKSNECDHYNRLKNLGLVQTDAIEKEIVLNSL